MVPGCASNAYTFDGASGIRWRGISPNEGMTRGSRSVEASGSVDRGGNRRVGRRENRRAQAAHTARRGAISTSTRGARASRPGRRGIRRAHRGRGASAGRVAAWAGCWSALAAGGCCGADEAPRRAGRRSCGSVAAAQAVAAGEEVDFGSTSSRRVAVVFGVADSFDAAVVEDEMRRWTPGAVSRRRRGGVVHPVLHPGGEATVLRTRNSPVSPAAATSRATSRRLRHRRSIGPLSVGQGMAIEAIKARAARTRFGFGRVFVSARC